MANRFTNGRPKTNLDFTEPKDSGWQWYRLGHMQVCTLPNPHHQLTNQFFTGRMPFLSPNQQRQSTEGKDSDNTPPQPFYGPFSGTIRVRRCQKRTSGLYGARGD